MTLFHTKDTKEQMYYLPSTTDSAPIDPNRDPYLYRNPAPVTSVGSCCSARILSYVYGQALDPATIWSRSPTLLTPRKYASVTKYIEMVGPNPYYAFPFEILAAYAMEKVLGHLVDGGGQWTWFLADRMYDDGTMKVRSKITRTWRFMRYIQDNPQLGQILISQPAMGNHGGLCVGAVWTPNREGLREAVGVARNRVNDHADALLAHFSTPKPKSEAADEVAKLW